MDGPNPSEMDIKMLIPAPIYCLRFWNLYDPQMENTRKLLSQESKKKQLKWKHEKKIKNTECKAVAHKHI